MSMSILNKWIEKEASAALLGQNMHLFVKNNLNSPKRRCNTLQIHLRDARRFKIQSNKFRKLCFSHCDVFRSYQCKLTGQQQPIHYILMYFIFFQLPTPGIPSIHKNQQQQQNSRLSLVVRDINVLVAYLPYWLSKIWANRVCRERGKSGQKDFPDG